MSQAESVHAAARETIKSAEYLVVFFVAYSAYRADPDELLLRRIVAIATLAVSASALIQEIIGSPEGVWLAGHAVNRISGFLEGPNQLAAYLGILIPVSLVFALFRPAGALERIAIFSGAITTLLTFSRGGIASLAVGCALIIFLRRYPHRLHTTLVSLGLIFGALLVIALGVASGRLTIAERIFGSTTNAYNGGLGTRSELWNGSLRLWKTHPMLGVGPGNFEVEVSRFTPGLRTHANSVYFQVLAEQGLIGEIALFALIAASIIAFARRPCAPLPLAALAVATMMALHQVMDTLWIFPKVGVSWWIVLAIAAATIDPVSRTVDSPGFGAVAPSRES